MAKRNSTTIAAVGYLRRSTNKQEKSLTDQRREVERYAKEHGYRIVRWYEDDGISGDDTQRRAGFLDMHADACNGREFDAILCWDQDRFGRFDSLEAGRWCEPLRAAGVRLVTVNDGEIDWNDFTGRVMYSLKQEGKHQFLRDLSRNTARGLLSAVHKGNLPGQKAPYGLDRMLCDAEGSHRQRVRAGEKFSKDRSWHATFVPSDDQQKVDTVQWLFATYADTDTGLRGLADELNESGVLSPDGGDWTISTIGQILRNKAYAGDLVWNRRASGKYNRISGDAIKERGPSEPQAKKNDEAEWIIVQNAFEALVGRKTFNRVQAKLTARRQGTTRRSKHGDNYILSGIVFCGHCGAKMFGNRKTRHKSGKTYVYENYTCSTYHQQGSQQCGYHTVRQQAMLTLVLDKLRDAVLAGGQKDALRARVREQLTARQGDAAHVAKLQRRLEKLTSDLDRGTKRMLRVDDDAVAEMLSDELSGMRRERDRVAGELDEMRRETPADLDAAVDEAVDRLWTLSQEFEKADPARLRELVRQCVDRIDIWWSAEPKGKRMFHQVRRGTIMLRPLGLFSNSVRSGKPMSMKKHSASSSSRSRIHSRRSE